MLFALPVPPCFLLLPPFDVLPPPEPDEPLEGVAGSFCEGTFTVIFPLYVLLFFDDGAEDDEVDATLPPPPGLFAPPEVLIYDEDEECGL